MASSRAGDGAVAKCAGVGVAAGGAPNISAAADGASGCTNDGADDAPPQPNIGGRGAANMEVAVMGAGGGAENMDAAVAGGAPNMDAALLVCAATGAGATRAPLSGFDVSQQAHAPRSRPL